MTSSTSAAADKEIWVKVIIKDTWFKPDSNYLILHEPISNSYGWVTKEQISKLEAQQTDDTLSGLKKEIEGERKTIRELGTELLATDRWVTIRAIGGALAHWKDDSAKAEGKE